jgi:hypothetical protein
MHVSRVAALLLRAVRRSRRPLAMALVAGIVAGICVVTDVSGTAMAAEQPKNASAGSSSTDVSAGGDTTTVTSTSGSSTSTPAPSASSSSSPSGGASGTSTGSSKPTPKATVKSKPVVVKKSTPVNKPMLVPLVVLTLAGVTTVADTNHDGRPSPGDVATTLWKVKNTGATQATALTIGATPGSGTCTPTTVAPGASSNCTTTTTLTQSEVDAAKITVTGTATAMISGSSSSSAAATAPFALKVVSGLQFGQRIFRISDRDHNGRTSQGDLLQFVFTVKNTGSQTVHGLIIIDAKAASSHVSISCSTTTLAPRQSTTCRSGGYNVTGSQAKAGFLTNTGQARVTTPAGTHFFSAVSKVSVGVLKPPPPVRPHLALRMYVAKIGASGAATFVAAGDTISYGFVVSNTGNSRISGLKITDQKLDSAKIAIHCGTSSLSSGASTRCTSDPMTITIHVLAQQDLTNFASVHGTASNGVSVSAFDRITIGLSASIHALVGSSGIRALPRTGGVNTTPLTLGFWMVLIGLGLVVAGRRPGRPGTAAIAPDRRSWISSRAIR